MTYLNGATGRFRSSGSFSGSETRQPLSVSPRRTNTADQLTGGMAFLRPRCTVPERLSPRESRPKLLLRMVPWVVLNGLTLENARCKIELQSRSQATLVLLLLFRL